MTDGPRAIGKREYEAYKADQNLTRGQSMKAKCYECMGGYADGRMDCGIKDCPLYPWMPYKGKGEEQ